MLNRISILVVFCLLLITQKAVAQRGANDSILVSAVVVGKDTFPNFWSKDIYIYGKASKDLVRRRREQQKYDEEYERLRYNVYKVYPYAVAASYILHDIDSVLGLLYSKDAKRIFKQRKEDELNRKFKGELENLTISQGQVLVKLIARQTGKPCFQIVRELKGGFNAAIWQTVALVFSNNLKNNYDPLGDDADIEAIVLEIESRGHFEYK